LSPTGSGHAPEPMRWRLLRTWDGAPGWNMALDEALLEHAGAVPVLRFYTWSPDTLSLGYFQRWRDVPEVALASAVVRRLTGGGAIHHAGELTFSIAAPADHPLYAGEVRGSYERVHAALAAGLLPIGVRAHLVGAEALRSDSATSAMCFHRSTPLDLAWDGAKGVGSAQRRGHGRVLHHGSIKLDTTPLEGRIATLRAAGVASPTALADALLPTLAAHFAARFEEGEPTPSERAQAQARAAFFTSEAHLRRR